MKKIRMPVRLSCNFAKVNFSVDRGSALDQLKKFQSKRITEANVMYPGAEKSGVVIRKVGDKFRISMSKYKDEYDIQDAAEILENELGRDPLFDIGDYTT